MMSKSRMVQIRNASARYYAVGIAVFSVGLCAVAVIAAIISASG